MNSTTLHLRSPLRAAAQILSLAAGLILPLALFAANTPPSFTIAGVTTSVSATGKNNEGELGDGTTTMRTTPAPIPGLTGVRQVAGGSLHSLAVKFDGTVWAWGDNYYGYGELGHGTTTQRTTPIQVPGLTVVIQMAAGQVLAIARHTHGKPVVGGQFTTFNGVPRNRIARLNTDGSTDFTFNPGAGANQIVWTLRLQPAGRLVAGGAFTTYAGVSCNRITRIHNDGAN